MPATISHVFTNAIADGTNTQIVRPSDWNSSHAFTYAAAGSEISGAFSNANGLSFGLSGTAVTASHNALTTQNAQQVSAANGSYTFTNLSFSNANGVSFGTSAGSAITASHNALTTAMASNRGSDFVQATAAFAGTSASGTIASDGISISIGPYLTTAMASNRGSDFVAATAAFAGTSASGTIASNGISVSIGPYITTAMLSNAATISNIKVSAGTLSANRSDITFANSNNVTFGLNTNGVITASAPNAGAGAVNFSAGTTSSALDSVVFSNSNGVSFGLNGSTITASVAAGAALTVTQFMPVPFISGSQTTSESPTTFLMHGFTAPNHFAFSGVQVLKSFTLSVPGATSQASTGAARWSYSHGLTLFQPVNTSNSSSQLTTIASGSLGLTFAASYSGTSQSFEAHWVTDTTGGTTSFATTSSDGAWTQFAGAPRVLQIPMVATLSPGEYFAVHRHSTTTATTQSALVLASMSDFHITAQSMSVCSIGFNRNNNSVPSMGGMYLMEGGVCALLTTITTNNTMNRSVLGNTPTFRARHMQFINKAIP